MPKLHRVKRLQAKAQKIRRRLGGSGNLLEPFPVKPKRMHWQTYLHLRQEGELAELVWGMAKLGRLQRMADTLAQNFLKKNPAP
jgi:hypothetical protein